MIKNNITEIGTKCVGCFLCQEKCPTHAINKKISIDGFEYPIIDSNKCIACGICLKTCPVNIMDKKNYPIKTYLTLSKYKEERNSSSGGLFFSLAKKFIEEMDGYVAGCVFKEKCKIEHILTKNINDVYKMQGSKYIESSIDHLYERISEALLKNKKVLFSGTPCQCAAMKKNFGKDNNFFCIDIVCHGVPSKYLWNIEVENLQRKYNFDKLTFRYKDKYEKTGYYLSLFKNNTLIKRISYQEDGYYSLFMNSKSFRKSCYQCQFSSNTRIADITMGDCNTWLDYNYFYPEKSLSIALINTPKGYELWEMIKSNMNFIELNYDKEKTNNKQLSQSSSIEKRMSDEEMLKLLNKELSLDRYAVGLSNKDKFKSILKKIITVETREKIRKLVK